MSLLRGECWEQNGPVTAFFGKYFCRSKLRIRVLKVIEIDTSDCSMAVLLKSG